MSKKRVRIMVMVAVAVLLIAIIAISGYKKDIGPCTEYKCDVKLRVVTTIEITKDGKDFVEISGRNIYKTFNDPLTMYDMTGNKIAYADDQYHLISQDSHSVFVNNEVSVEMVGLFEPFGESYDIYNKDGQKVAEATFNYFNTNGEMYDMQGNLIADYNSRLFFRDYDVRIADSCQLDEETVLMIFASYFSDQSADS